MLFKTETHCHSMGVSKCSHADNETIIRRYLDAGYHSLVLTNHLCRDTFSGMPDARWEEKMDFFLGGYRSLKEAADGRLHILPGAEIRFAGCGNDYLVLGADEAFFRALGNFEVGGLAEFSKLMRERGLLLFQAHPFRYGMTVVNPAYLDGVEVFNGHAGHKSNNEAALFWAEHHRLKQLSGSDFHDPDSRTTGGILTDLEITNSEELLFVLKSGQYRLLRD